MCRLFWYFSCALSFCIMCCSQQWLFYDDSTLCLMKVSLWSLFNPTCADVPSFPDHPVGYKVRFFSLLSSSLSWAPPISYERPLFPRDLTEWSEKTTAVLMSSGDLEYVLVSRSQCPCQRNITDCDCPLMILKTNKQSLCGCYHSVCTECELVLPNAQVISFKPSPSWETSFFVGCPCCYY